MGQNLFLILILVSAAWQILGSVMEKRAKEAKQRQLEEAGRSRGGQPSASSRATEVRAQMPGGVEASGRPGEGVPGLETIDARRRAQIEELRRRALERARGAAPASPRSNSGQAGQAERPGRATMADARRTDARRTDARRTDARRTVARDGGDDDMARGSRGTGNARAGRPEVARDWAELDQRRASERAAKDEAARRRNVREAADQKRRGIETQTRRQLASGPAAAPATPTAAPHRQPSLPMSGAGFGAGFGAAGRVGRIRSIVHNREALRDLLVLREIMDPPVSMRTSPIPADRSFEG